MNNQAVSVLMLDLSGTITGTDDSLYRLTGYTGRELIGKNYAVLFNEAEILRDNESQVLLPVEDRYGMKEPAILHRKDGFFFQAFLSTTAIRNAENEITGYVQTILKGDIKNYQTKSTDTGSLEGIDAEKVIHRLKEELIRSNRELYSVFDYITDGVISLDSNWCYTYANKQAGILINKDPESLIGKMVWDLFPEAIGSETYKALHKAMDEKVHVHNVDYFAPLDLWQENHIYPTDKGIYVFIRNITLEKKAEEKIKESEALYRLIVETANEGIWVIDENNCSTFINQYLLDMLGYSYEEVIGKSLFDFMDEASGAIMHNNLETRRKGVPAQYEFLCYTKTGTPVQVLISSSPIFKNGKYAGTLAMITDITDIKNNEAILIKQKELTESLINGLPGLFYMYDEDGQFYRWNKNYENITGYTSEEIRKMKPIDFYVASEQKLIQNRMKEVFFASNAARGLEVNLQVKSGEIIPFMINSWKVAIDGKSYLMGIGTDITEKQRTQEQLMLSEQNLKHSYQEIRELASHLQVIREEERKDIAREIHDELGQQLTALKFAVSMAKKKINSQETVILAELDEAMEMINHVIGTVRKIASDLRPVIIEELGLTAALHWYTRDFSKRTSIHCVLKDYHTPEHLDNMVSNTIYRIYQESLTNVARHSQATEVRSELTCENGVLNLTIRDNGIGFDPEILKTKKSFGILGIRERALMINGDFNLESKINQGTIMTVRVNLSSGNN